MVSGRKAGGRCLGAAHGSRDGDFRVAVIDAASGKINKQFSVSDLDPSPNSTITGLYWTKQGILVSYWPNGRTGRATLVLSPKTGGVVDSGPFAVAAVTDAGGLLFEQDQKYFLRRDAGAPASQIPLDRDECEDVMTPDARFVLSVVSRQFVDASEVRLWVVDTSSGRAAEFESNTTPEEGMVLIKKAWLRPATAP